MALSIPDRHRPIIGRLLTLPESELERLSKALGAIKKPSLSLDEIAKKIVGKTSLDQEAAENVLLLFISLYNIQRTGPIQKGELLSDLLVAIESDNDFASTGEQLSAFRSFAERVFGFEKTIGVIAKSYLVLSGYEHIYCKATIFTDLRPIFADNIEDKLSGFLVRHNLRLSYHPRDFSTEDFHVVLSESDLEKLADVIERARKKEARLKNFGAEVGIELITGD